MTNTQRKTSLGYCLAVMLLLFAPAFAVEDLQQEPVNPVNNVLASLSVPPAVEDIRLRWTEYLKNNQSTKKQTKDVLAIWTSDDGQAISRERLGKIMASLVVLHPETVLLAEAVRRGDAQGADDGSWLQQEEIPVFLQDHLKLWIAQGWVQQGRYSEALTLLEGIRPSELLDPVSYAFALAAIHHQRADKKRGMPLLEWLRVHRDVIPERYAVLGDLMHDDLRQLEPGSLDDISRRMKQIRQQLDLGRTGDHVLETEDEVLRMLDKLIEEESKKQSSQSQSAGQGGGSSRPPKASPPMGGKGAGQVTKKKIGNSAGWGDLPPKEREQAMQELSREFPAHYREVIEAYFRELARQQK